VREPAVAKRRLGLEARADPAVLADAVVGVRARVVRCDGVGVLAKAAVAAVGRVLAERREKGALATVAALGVADGELVVARVEALTEGHVRRQGRGGRRRARRRRRGRRRRVPRPRDGKGAQEAEVLLRADARARRLGVVVPRAVDVAMARASGEVDGTSVDEAFCERRDLSLVGGPRRGDVGDAAARHGPLTVDVARLRVPLLGVDKGRRRRVRPGRRRGRVVARAKGHLGLGTAVRIRRVELGLHVGQQEAVQPEDEKRGGVGRGRCQRPCTRVRAHPPCSLPYWHPCATRQSNVRASPYARVRANWGGGGAHQEATRFVGEAFAGRNGDAQHVEHALVRGGVVGHGVLARRVGDELAVGVVALLAVARADLEVGLRRRRRGRRRVAVDERQRRRRRRARRARRARWHQRARRVVEALDLGRHHGRALPAHNDPVVSGGRGEGEGERGGGVGQVCLSKKSRHESCAQPSLGHSAKPSSAWNEKRKRGLPSRWRGWDRFESHTRAPRPRATRRGSCASRCAGKRARRCPRRGSVANPRASWPPLGTAAGAGGPPSRPRRLARRAGAPRDAQRARAPRA